MFSFNFYYPDGKDDGIRTLSVDVETTVSQTLSTIIQGNIYGDRIKWGDSPFLYQGEGFQWDSNDSVALENATQWLKSNPPKLPSLQLLSVAFPEPGSLDPEKVHIILLTKNLLTTTFSPRRTVSLPPTAPRTSLVSYLYDVGQKLRFFHVRGTPGCGKTTLCNLLYNHIMSQEPGVLLSSLGVYQKVGTISDSLNKALRRGDAVDVDDGRRHWVLVDEAQTTYRDSQLWSTFFKTLAPTSLSSSSLLMEAKPSLV
ncbi:hypothetical protein B0H13DRAFT_2654111 [Mycena leptocephala]|nr:hypothetical protein B0H13DRAFT_2654111 [Mycena leptocephala]